MTSEIPKTAAKGPGNKEDVGEKREKGENHIDIRTRRTAKGERLKS